MLLYFLSTRVVTESWLCQDLRAINHMMRESESVRKVGKRLLGDDAPDDSGVSPPKQANFVANKIQDLFVDRLMAKSQDAA